MLGNFLVGVGAGYEGSSLIGREMKQAIYNIKIRLDKSIRVFVEKHTSFKDTFAGLEIGNVLVAVSTTMLMALGSLPLSLPVLISLAVFLILLGVVGKYIDEVSDDNERLKLYEENLKELLLREFASKDSSLIHSDIVSNDNLQSTDSKIEGRSIRGNEGREYGDKTTSRES